MISVSIVDDEKKTLRVHRDLSERLQRDFAASACMETPKPALQHFAADNPDVVLMDINMAGYGRD